MEKKQQYFLFVIALLTVVICSCRVDKDSFVQNCFVTAGQQITPLAALSPSTDGYPRTLKNDGILHTTRLNDWTEGFFPGTLWYIYEYTRQEEWKEKALRWTLPLEKLQYLTSHHDIGFLMYCSYGNAYRLTEDESYKAILVQSAKSLCTRFSETTKCIKSWDYRESWDKMHKWYYPVIVDNMMNLELLYFATKATGDPYYADIATTHAETTMKNHIREDYGTYHVVNYDLQDGSVEHQGTCQGFADNSTWARGQAWAIYGYTLVYRETKDPKFLDTAQKLADFWIGHPNLPEDMIPYWDFNAVDKKCVPADWARERPYMYTSVDSPRDASAAAITASALFELSTYLPDGKKYYNAAIKTLHTLASSEYFATDGSNGHFLIKHCVGSLPHGVEIDVPLVYADYYFVEALIRYNRLKNIKNNQ
ncbi:glycoside hydrolase family 88 protein [Bacteroides sp.]